MANRNYGVVSNKDLKHYIKECAKYFTLPETHYNYVTRKEALEGLIEEIQRRIDYEEKIKTYDEQMAYDIFREIVSDEGEIYYDAGMLKNIKKMAEDTLANRSYTETIANL